MASIIFGEYGIGSTCIRADSGRSGRMGIWSMGTGGGAQGRAIVGIGLHKRAHLASGGGTTSVGLLALLVLGVWGTRATSCR
jgi:hypothetical protein